MQDLAAERAFYDQLFEQNPENEHITDGYDELHDLAFERARSGRVLDLGCGTGSHAVRIARRGRDVIAVDLTRPGVRAARERFARAGLRGAFVVADATNLPFRDNAVAITWSSLLLHHFPRLDELPAEISRVTRHSVIAFEPNAHNLLTWFAFNVVNPIWGLSSTTKNQRALWPRRLKSVFQRLGFRVETFKFIHRAWDDRQSASLMAILRRTHDALVSWLPLRFRANKFLVVFEKPAA